MAFSMFVIVLGLIVLAVTYFHYTQGFFSSAISAILCVFAAVLAVSYHEVVVEKFMATSAVADIAHGSVVLIMFGTVYLVCRLIFDKVVPGNVTLPSGADKAGALVMGAVAGVFAAGVAAFAAQSLPFGPALMGYARFQAEAERDVSIPQVNGRNMQRFLRDSLNTDLPLHLAEADKQAPMIPADEILMQTLYRVSEGGALAGRPVSEVHPDWLTELFGQRLGIQSAGKRTAVSTPGATEPDVIAVKDEGGAADAGVYVLDRQLKQRAHEFPTIAKAGKDPLFPKVDPKADATRMTVVVRLYFGKKARDTKDSMIRFSPSSIRLVTKKKDPAAGGHAFANYFPVGTVEDGAEFYYNRPDDFMFIVPGEGSLQGVDVVFQVERDGFVTGAGPNNDLAAAKIADGTFLEVKRLGRVNLGGQPLMPFGKLKKNPAVAVMRKTLVKDPPKEEVVAKEVTPEELAQKLIGSWETDGEGATKSKLTADGEQMEFVQASADDGGAPTTIKGRYKVAGGEGGITLQHDGVGTDGKIYKGKYTFRFSENDNKMDLDDPEATRSWGFRRVGKSAAPTAAPAAPPAAPAAPAAPGAAPPAPPEAAPAAMAKDASLVVGEVRPGRKFFAPIRVPKGTTGEAAVGGGTVTVEETNLKVITLPPVAPAALGGGQGEPLNQLAVPAGSAMVQVEATPGAAGGGWAWKDRVGEIAVVDKDGNRHAAVGVWVLINGGKEVVVRFNADGGASLSDFTPPATPPTKVHFAFAIPEGQQVKQVMIGDAELKAFNPPVP